MKRVQIKLQCQTVNGQTVTTRSHKIKVLRKKCLKIKEVTSEPISPTWHHTCSSLHSQYVLQEEHAIVISRPCLKEAISTPERTKPMARSDLKDVCHEVGAVVTLSQWSSELVLNWSHMLSVLELGSQ